MKEETKKTPAPKQLYRSKTDRVLGGVSGGLADYFAVDSTLIRIIFIILFFSGGAGIFVYLVLWLIIPSRPGKKIAEEDTIKENVEEIKTRAEEIGHKQGRQWFGILLLSLGVIFLLRNLGFFRIFVGRLWPIVLVIIGIIMLTRE
jgi:phage shock protein PspC (stress-responsive transcriptional regulator)